MKLRPVLDKCDVLLIPGHSPGRPGARNPGRDARGELPAYEYEFNEPLVARVMADLRRAGVDAQQDRYSVQGGNVARWNGRSRLLVEFHCNAFNGQGSGTSVLYAAGSMPAFTTARLLAVVLADALQLPLRGNMGALAVMDEPQVRPPINGRDSNGIGGGYLIYGVSQRAHIAEPFFIDNDHDLAHAELGGGKFLVDAYVEGIRRILASLPAEQEAAAA